MTAVYVIGAFLTAALIAILFARRYPGNRSRLWIGIALGLAAMLFWPITLWVALALWQTGFVGSRQESSTPPRLPKKVVLPAAAVGSIVTLALISATAPPAPVSTADSTPIVTSAGSPTPTLVVVPSSTTTTATPSPTTSPATTTTPTPARVATATPTPGPAPRPVPKPQPKPQPQPRLEPKPQPEPEPEPEQKADPQPDDGGGSGGGTVNPGSFCKPGGSAGVTNKGTPMVCRPAADGRLRWGKA